MLTAPPVHVAADQRPSTPHVSLTADAMKPTVQVTAHSAPTAKGPAPAQVLLRAPLEGAVGVLHVTAAQGQT